MAADFMVADAAMVNDGATYEDPKQSPTGLLHVLVNGILAMRERQYTGASRAGDAR
jgi:N-acyl-D-amino-acid deacylase